MAGDGTYLTVLDRIVVHVLGSGGVLADVLILGELVHEYFAAVPAIGHGEAVLRLGLFDGKRQFAERGVRLLTVKCLSQSRQIYEDSQYESQ